MSGWVVVNPLGINIEDGVCVEASMTSHAIIVVADVSVTSHFQTGLDYLVTIGINLNVVN